jgi:hypothetical protein
MSPVAVVRDSGGTVVQRRTAIWEGKITERYDGIDYTYPIVEVYEFDNDPETADRGLLNRPSVQADVLLRVLQRRGTEGNLETLPGKTVARPEIFELPTFCSVVHVWASRVVS